MKPCVSRCESVALLACGLCPEDQAADLRRHLEACDGCREHLRQLSAVCAEHTEAAAHLPMVRVPARLSHRVASRIRAGSPTEPSHPQPYAWLGWARMAGLAAVLALVAVCVFRILGPSKSPTPGRMAQAPQPLTAAHPAGAPIPGTTLVAYRHALNRSPEALEELLTAESVKPTSRAPIARPVTRDLPELEL